MQFLECPTNRTCQSFFVPIGTGESALVEIMRSLELIEYVLEGTQHMRRRFGSLSQQVEDSVPDQEHQRER
jgi:hypothetical protein